MTSNRRLVALAAAALTALTLAACQKPADDSAANANAANAAANTANAAANSANNAAQDASRAAGAASTAPAAAAANRRPRASFAAFG